MTERIEMLKRFQWDKRHHVYRRAAEENVERVRVQKRLAELEQRSNVKKEESA